MRELEKLVSRTALDELTALVLFAVPDGAPPGWAHTESWRIAESIRGVTVQADERGVDTLRFGARTSGEVLLFGPDDRLLYHGGITGARGHEGDNLGRTAVLDALRSGRPSLDCCPTYGCPLFEDQAATASGKPSS